MIAAMTREIGVLFEGLLILAIRVYQWTLSPILGGQCRFEPTCSHYGIACIKSHGPLRGSWLTLRRISRCHPFCAGGYDPPPLGRHQRALALPTSETARART